MRKRARPHQHQFIERHVFHGARDRADIAGMARIDQDDANESSHALLFYRQLMQPLLNIGMRAARRAGDLIVRSLSRLDSLKIDSKGRNDFVTDIDRKAEAEIIASSAAAIPHHAFLAEESGRSGESEYVWIIDPLDGTTNFLHGFPTFAVSIAVEHRGRLQHAVIYDPMRQEFFTASRGDGAQLEGKKIRVSTQRALEGSLIGTGFPYRMNAVHVDDYLAILKVIMSSRGGRAPAGRRRARSRLCGGGPNRRLLGIRLVALGYRRRHLADPGGGRARRHAGRRGVRSRAQHRGRQSQGVPGPCSRPSVPSRRRPCAIRARPARTGSC